MNNLKPYKKYFINKAVTLAVSMLLLFITVIIYKRFQPTCLDSKASALHSGQKTDPT